MGTAQATRAGLTAFVRAWSRALREVAYVPLRPAEQQRVLARLARRLVTALRAPQLDPAEGRRIGEDLVAAGFATAEVLDRTVTLLATRLAADAGLPAEAAGRIGPLLGSFAGGFTEALRDQTLAGQEAIREAAMAAQSSVEQALRDSQARLRHLATHDPVTGLPNRTLLVERLGELAAQAPAGVRLAVCCLDLDRFAAVNDSLGFQVGDQLLVAVADRLRELATWAGWLVTRLEDDQFAVVAELTGHADPGLVADRTLAALAHPFPVGDIDLPVTASAGLAGTAVAGTAVAGTAAGMAGTASELIGQAQVALRWAKAAGPGRWRRYHPDRAAQDAARWRLCADLPGGLRRGEFTLAYQPLVDLASGHLAGVEALARWRHPGHGLLAAGRFIGLAEQTGLVAPLGNRLLAEACQQAATWPADPGVPYVSVNVAAAQLHQSGFAGYVAQVLDQTGLPAHRLQLELTEHAIVDPDGPAAALPALAQLGVRLAVDDFGTGYSSLARLRDLPLRELKLDAAFVAPNQSGQARGRDEQFLASVVDLGHLLGLTVTAEGVETADQAQRVRAAGCDTGQGWFHGRPVPAQQITQDWLAASV